MSLTPKLKLPVARRIGWISVCFSLCFFILLVFGHGAGPALAEKPAQVDLSVKDILWDFRYYIIGTLVFCLSETALIIFLVVQRRQKTSDEKSLRKAEERYRNIFEDALEGIFETSPQGQPLTANPALARVLGLTFNTLPGFSPDNYC